MAGMRIGGLASGMDIDQIVSDLMRAERIPLDKTKQKKQTLEWRRDAFREMNTLLSKLRDATLNMRLQSTFLSKKTTSSNEEKLTAVAASNAGNVSYEISKATLAKAAYNISTDKVSKYDKLDANKRLWDLQNDFKPYETNPEETVPEETKNKFFGQWENEIEDIIHVHNAGNKFKLSRANIKDGTLDEIIVTPSKGESISFTVVDSIDKLDENSVYVDKETGYMTFGKNLDKGSRIEASYQSFKNETISGTNLKEYEISTPGVIDIKDDKIFVKTTVTKDGEKKTIDIPYTKVDSLAKLDEVENSFLIVVDEETNKAKIVFSNTINKDSTISVSYTHQVLNTSITTYNADGHEVKESFTFDGSENLNGILNKINTSKVGVNIYYDEFTDKFSITRKETGDFNKDTKKVEDEKETVVKNPEMQFTGGLFAAFNLNSDNEQGGENAKITINGLETERHSNTFTINDFTFTLKGEINGTPVTVTSKNDTDKVFDSIKNFVDLYNETIDKISSKIKEEKNRDYQPLTEEQKESLSEKEIEKWENLAKSGVIRNDPILTSVLNQMRIDFYSAVNSNTGLYKQLSSIGITTSTNYLEGGKLVINEDKLRQAIEDDPEAIFNLFAADGEDYGEKGISRRLRDTLTSAIEKVTNTAGNELKTNSQFTIGKELDDIEDRITNFERILSQKEERYWKMYTAMEKAIQKSNEQSAYLMQQLGAWTGGQ